MVASNKNPGILSRPKRIRWSGMGGTSYLNLLSVGAGRTALVWLSENAAGQADSIAVALSTDDGQTWSTPQLHQLHA